MLIIRISFDTFIGAAVRADISHFAGRTRRSHRRGVGSEGNEMCNAVAPFMRVTL